MNKLSYVLLAAGAAALPVLHANSVTVQGVSPGVAQVGNTNVTGIGTFGGINATGTGIPTYTITAAHTTGTAVKGTSASVAIIGESSSDSGQGVRGVTTNLTGRIGNPSSAVYGDSRATSGPAYGVFGRADSTSGVGVKGISYSTVSGKGMEALCYGPSSYAVYGFSVATSGTPYAIYGMDNNAGFAVYANGDMGASGVKPFRIDHPSDPQNKYLLHYASESPAPQNFYSGNVTTDARGQAWVQLPEYFGDINANFKYQLTVVDDQGSSGFVQVKVGRKIRNNQFMIMSSAPRVEVSWRVEADRNDLYVRSRKPKDVVDKVGPEIGTYQRPDLYGEPRTKGMPFQPEMDLRAKADASK